ncbi:MAG: M48 family metalloprotease [Flavobacterium sp.]|nr:M48 family metalloprotease [Flavobacterium sp.]
MNLKLFLKSQLITAFICLNVLFSYSQTVIIEYSPKNKDSLINYISTISDKKIQKFGNQYAKKIKELILERKKNFISKIEDSTYIFNDRINKYLNSILKEIYLPNQNISKSDFYFFINRSPIPNAACYGNGIFTINLGLFNFVNSDDELAFIVCHEIAHYLLEHNDQSLLSFIQATNSKEIKKKINQVKKLDYGKRKAYNDVIEELTYNFLRRSRKVEIEADSVGLQIFSKTKFNVRSSLASLENLKLSDSIIFNENSKLKEHFNFENYPFKENWLNKEQTPFDLTDVSNDYSFDKDSLKTHPDIPFRVGLLNKMINDKNILITPVNKKLKEIKQIIGLISIYNFINQHKVDLALYETLVLFNKNELDEQTYSLLVSQIIKKIYELKVNHDFGKYVSQVSPFSDEKYLNEVRQFLHNIELKNIKKIGLNFCLKYQNKMINDNDFKKTTEYFNKLNL